jgi:hypothetical protein
MRRRTTQCRGLGARGLWIALLLATSAFVSPEGVQASDKLKVRQQLNSKLKAGRALNRQRQPPTRRPAAGRTLETNAATRSQPAAQSAQTRGVLRHTQAAPTGLVRSRSPQGRPVGVVLRSSQSRVPPQSAAQWGQPMVPAAGSRTPVAGNGVVNPRAPASAPSPSAAAPNPANVQIPKPVTGFKPINTVGAERVRVTDRVLQALIKNPGRQLSADDVKAMRSFTGEALLEQFRSTINNTRLGGPSPAAPGLRYADLARPKNGNAFVPADAPK